MRILRALAVSTILIAAIPASAMAGHALFAAGAVSKVESVTVVSESPGGETEINTSVFIEVNDGDQSFRFRCGDFQNDCRGLLPDLRDEDCEEVRVDALGEYKTKDTSGRIAPVIISLRRR